MFSLLQRQKKLKRKNSRRTRKVCQCVVLLTEYLLGGKIKWLISIPRLLNCVFFRIYLLISYIFHHKYAKQNCFNFIKCLDTTVNFINFLLVFVSIYEYMLANRLCSPLCGLCFPSYCNFLTSVKKKENSQPTGKTLWMTE